MAAPMPVQSFKALNPRYVTKTSLPNPKQAIALALILWLVNERPSHIEYGREIGAKEDGGIIDDDIISTVNGYAFAHGIELDRADIASCLRGNALLESQLESLSVAFELVWRLGTVSFGDGTPGRCSERTGGKRIRKKIRFSTSVDLIGILLEENPDKFARVLMNWLTSGQVDADEGSSRRLAHMLGILSEPTSYKTSKGATGTVFSIRGVYDALLSDDNAVDVVDPGEEAQGPTRILKSAIGAGFFPALNIKGSSVTLDGEANQASIAAYADRMQTSAKISQVETRPVRKNDMESKRRTKTIDKPHNYIFFGAPGTGKSYELNKLAIGTNDEPGLFGKNCVTRVTFYPDYTNSQFVGSFKPYSDLKDGSKISYKFVAGPFLNTYLKAITHPYDNYALLIEEINRANPAAVFGDVFQLLDRDKNGDSVYQIANSKEMADYIDEYLGNLSNDEKATIENYYDPDLKFDDFREMSREELRLPPNMYIWATMNSADQGVFPMDTAFKRRWDFRYMGINEGQDSDIDGMPLSELRVSCGESDVRWNDLRKAINNFLITDDIKVNEDKLLGPFFVSPSALTRERFTQVFKDKVLLYLYEDAGKTKRTKIFRAGLKTYSQVCDAFEKEGTGIFGNGFVDSDLLLNGERDTADSNDPQE